MEPHSVEHEDCKGTSFRRNVINFKFDRKRKRFVNLVNQCFTSQNIPIIYIIITYVIYAINIYSFICYKI